MATNRFWLKWIIDYSLAELLAIGISATVGRLVLVEASDYISDSPRYIIVLLFIIVGALEGWTIGYFQWRSLRKLVFNFSEWPWTPVTIIATAIAWFAVVPPTIFIAAFFVDFGAIAKYYSLLYSILAGMTFGGFIGLCQFFVLKKFFRHAMVWVISSMLGWMLSFLLVYLSVTVLRGGHSTPYVLAVMILACIASGLAQGIITGTCVHLLMEQKKPVDRIS